ncbi:AraC family transcriptional regulator [Pontibaca methylaminivorans]|uniref:Transcriptional regulator, AraC family n=1 Tax=Pontibaca methylaminivorans TaxID=515897 RepID=A0A1R3WJG6_9RHOB|nr:helix-turn-helix domain-containing protein [Pontibaca methylaminivorans]SIT76763.1 transcriptional regulator, AraC family [Pontibaca methylaminivorans]
MLDAPEPASLSPDPASIRVATLGQLTREGAWELGLLHNRPDHMLIWITRGQGVALLEGARKGIGAHNVIFVPAYQLFALDTGRQGFGQALIVPPNMPLPLPTGVHHLRIRDATAQAEMTMRMEALAREQATSQELRDHAITAHAELVAIWLRRQIAHAAHPAEPASDRQRLARAYFARLTRDFASGASISDHAGALGVSAGELTSVCRAETGRSAATLLSERLLHAARRRGLGAGGTPVADIARDLGFSSPVQFARFLRDHSGKAPEMLQQVATGDPDA